MLLLGSRQDEAHTRASPSGPRAVGFPSSRAQMLATSISCQTAHLLKLPLYSVSCAHLEAKLGLGYVMFRCIWAACLTLRVLVVEALPCSKCVASNTSVPKIWPAVIVRVHS